MDTVRIAVKIICVFIALSFISGVGCSKPNQSSPPASQPQISGSPTDPAVDLRLNWQAGGRYVMRMEMKQNYEFRREGADPGKGAQQTSLAHEYAITVTNEPTTDQRGMDLELLSIEMEETAGDRTFINYDSQNRVTGTGGNPAAEQLARLVGGHLTYLLDTNQNVVAEKGMDELLARANTSSRNGPQKGGKKGNWMSGPVTRQPAALESFKEMLALTALPTKQFHVGDSWPVKFQSDNSVGGPISIAATNLFRGWQEHDRKKCARIELNGVVIPKRTNSVDQLDKGAIRRGMIFDVASVSGVYWIDPASAFAPEVTFEQSFNRSGVFGSQRKQGTNSPPQKFTAQSRQTVTFKLIDMSVASAN